MAGMDCKNFWQIPKYHRLAHAQAKGRTMSDDDVRLRLRRRRWTRPALATTPAARRITVPSPAFALELDDDTPIPVRGVSADAPPDWRAAYPQLVAAVRDAFMNLPSSASAPSPAPVPSSAPAPRHSDPLASFQVGPSIIQERVDVVRAPQSVAPPADDSGEQLTARMDEMMEAVVFGKNQAGQTEIHMAFKPELENGFGGLTVSLRREETGFHAIFCSRSRRGQTPAPQRDQLSFV